VTADHLNVKAIFCDALDKATREERATYLEEVCGGRSDILSQVEELLRLHDGAGAFLESPPLNPGMTLESSPLTEGPGAVIGRYKLLEKIGEGGMAVVYMAEQTEPIRRKVALKIIKLGMDTRQVIARFEAERQALALMDHPSIAKVLDAGATETGRPYFVMELVTGVSITEYCDKSNLSTKDRLALFLQVCHAVQHAHQKGIIHRDIKPSNVMVTHQDGRPVPKVIDFGIAKATNQKLTEKTLFTRYAHIIGTPAYMSPEQAELSDLDIDTRSDIYSLGVLLYELLTGTTPFSEEELRKAGYIEMQRVIREQEPAKPSTKLTTLGEILIEVAKHRNATPDVLRKAVRGDLDWIVMKSLEKDRARRYETASSLAEDIRRHLESEPVLARGPSTTYRLRKFLRRHRVQVFVALALALVAVAAGVVVSLWNQDRLRLLEAQGLQDKDILSQAREQYAKTEREAALETIRPILDSQYVGPEAQLLQATILVDNRRFQEAGTILNHLLNHRAEVAGAAHFLLARVLWESEGLDAEKLQQIEEHRQKAEELLPETAEAYFLRAMTAPTVKEQLAALHKALQLGPDHYESLRLRALTYYASRKYESMRDDALGMTYLRRRDPLGHSLRAMALRELGKYAEAVAEYDQALARLAQNDPQCLDLAAQRGETLLRKGDYERVIADAEAHLNRWPDKPVFRYHRFCALTALGEYNQAAAVFQEMVQTSPAARNALWSWAAKYVFDTLAAGRSWHPLADAPTGAAFLPLTEAEEAYRELSAKGHRMTTDGFSAEWSPDDKKLAFSMGVTGNSGVALYDPATKETDLLIVPGKYPRWSPDGQYIAFVRDRQFLRVPEFVAPDPEKQPPAPAGQEVWLMKSDGSKPRRLAGGVWPSWGKDSTCVYYRAGAPATLYSISILAEDAQPKQIMPCPGFTPSVSPDNRCVAYMQGTSLKVIDLASQSLVAQWPLPVPSGGWGASAWSPSSKELCLGGSGGLENRTGLWIYRLGHSEPATTLGGPITVGSWALDGTKLVFELGAPLFEIWTADLASDVSTLEAMGPARTMNQHLRELVALCTRRIKTDPQDGCAYLDRARYYDYLHEREKANADMRRWSTVVSGRSPSGLWFGTSRDLRRVLDLPFNCELVFSAERPVNNMPVLSIAFGQKGRCEMKVCEIPLVVMSFLGLGLLSSLDAPPAHADFVFGTPTNLGPTVNSAYHDYGAVVSPDGLELYFCSNRPGGNGGYDIWVTKRTRIEDPWGPPTNLGPQINTSGWDAPGSMSADGLVLYMELSNQDLYTTTRATRDAPWGPRVNLGLIVNTSYMDTVPVVSADGLELFFSSRRPGGYGDADIWMSARTTSSDPWGTPVNLGSAVNCPAIDAPTWISPDGLTLFFFSDRSGGFGAVDAWVTTRATKGSPWGPARNLGPSINTSYSEWVTATSPDGRSCYLCDFGLVVYPQRPNGLGGADLWQAPILPIVDFNGDGKVDAKDMALLEVNLGKNTTLCDIGPFPWGDGVVDDKDLKVFMEYSMTPGPKASDVPCDVVLTWITRSFPIGYDVYLGTSQEAVKTASRTNPQGVLVSQGQPATSYAPAQPLEFSTTYYWRVDEVNAVMRPGEVWSFTTVAYPDYVVDDFESYATSGGKDLFNTWVDGYFVNFKTNGALVGLPAPVNGTFCESTIVHGGKQSLPLAYDNSNAALSEAVRTFDHAQDWTAGGIKTLSLWFQGVAGNTGQLYVKINSTKVPYDGAASNLAKPAWTEWNIDLSKLTGVNKVSSLTIGIEGAGAKGMLYIDDIRLYPKTSEDVTPAYPIKNVTATASSAQPGKGPEKTVDGSGLDKNDGHSTNASDMWLSTAVPPHWIQFEFDKVYALHELWVWNQNQTVEPILGFGAKTVKIEYSTDGTAWTALANVPEFARAPGQDSYQHNTTVSFGGVSAKYAKLTIEKGWGTAPSVGLGEVRFFYIPSASTPKP
jgi:serine/threonine protein kinase/Tol biopolymer transport system component